MASLSLVIVDWLFGITSSIITLAVSRGLSPPSISLLGFANDLMGPLALEKSDVNIPPINWIACSTSF